MRMSGLGIFYFSREGVDSLGTAIAEERSLGVIVKAFRMCNDITSHHELQIIFKFRKTLIKDIGLLK